MSKLPFWWTLIHNDDEWEAYVKTNGIYEWPKPTEYPVLAQHLADDDFSSVVIVTASDAFALLSAKRAMARRAHQKRGKVPP